MKSLKQKVSKMSELDILSRVYIWTGFLLIFVVGSWDDPSSKGYRIAKEVMIFSFAAFLGNILIILAVRALIESKQIDEDF